MMAENYLYRKENVLVTELVRRGLFGQVYYAEGAYLHAWRRCAAPTPRSGCVIRAATSTHR